MGLNRYYLQRKVILNITVSPPRNLYRNYEWFYLFFQFFQIYFLFLQNNPIENTNGNLWILCKYLINNTKIKIARKKLFFLILFYFLNKFDLEYIIFALIIKDYYLHLQDEFINFNLKSKIKQKLFRNKLFFIKLCRKKLYTYFA